MARDGGLWPKVCENYLIASVFGAALKEQAE
jgi:hypothetical protein